jgi:hypothetical protein
MLLFVGIASFLVPTAAAQEAEPKFPETVQITGIVRDFRATGVNGGHPDFENDAALNGRYAGSIAPLIGSDGRPEFTGKGARVGEQWRDDAHRAISQLLYDSFPMQFPHAR